MAVAPTPGPVTTFLGGGGTPPPEAVPPEVALATAPQKAPSSSGGGAKAKTGSMALRIRMAAMRKQGQGLMDFQGGGGMPGSPVNLPPRAPITPPAPAPTPPPPPSGGGQAAASGVVPAVNPKPMAPVAGFEDFGTLLENVQEQAFQDAKAKYAQEAEPTLGERFKKLREREIGILPGGLAVGGGLWGGSEAVKALRERGAQLAAERRAGISRAKRTGRGLEAAKAVKPPLWAKATRMGQLRGALQLPGRKSFVPRRAVRLGIRVGAPLAALWGAKGLLGREKQGADMMALALAKVAAATA